MRAVKRKKNEVKELARLKKIVEASKHDGGSVIEDVVMSNLIIGKLFLSLVDKIILKFITH